MEHRTNREGATMNTTVSEPVTGEPELRATYNSDEGTRQLVGQRIKGRVALSDIPIGSRGKVYLVERHVHCMHELEALEADYLALAARLGRPPLRSDWIFE
jgi:hypothetical protein